MVFKIAKFEFMVTVHYNSPYANCTQLWPLKAVNSLSRPRLYPQITDHAKSENPGFKIQSLKKATFSEKKKKKKAAIYMYRIRSIPCSCPYNRPSASFLSLKYVVLLTTH